MTIEFTRKQYLKVWRGDRYISQHVSELECAESASEDAEIHGDGVYEIRVGSEVWYEVSIMGLLAGSDLISIAPPNLSPSWTSTPGPNFVDGVGGLYDLEDDTFDPESDSLTYTLNGGSAAFPTGVSMDSAGLITATSSVVVGTTTGILVDIDDGINSLVTSPSFSIVIASTITDQELRDLGFLLVNDYAGVDPLGMEDSLAGINLAMLDAAEDPGYTVWFHADAIYKVSDTVRASTWQLGREISMMGGGGDGAPGARPIIRLENSASNFGSGKRPVVCWRHFENGATFGDNPSDPLDEDGIYRGKANNHFFAFYENIDIDNGGSSNPGAFSMYMPAAQRSFAGECKMTATGTAGGWWGLLGRNSPMQKIEVIGGVFQIRNDSRKGEGSAGSIIAGLTLTGDANTVTPIETQDALPLVIVGFKITQVNSNPIWTSASSAKTGVGILTMIDGEITTGGGTVFDNANGHTCYFRNVYISGTDNIIQSGSAAIISEIGTWKRINEYVYTDQTSTDGPAGKYKTRSFIAGSITDTPEPATDTDDSVSAPVVDYVARHTITVPHADSGPFINIEDEGAVGIDRDSNNLFEDNIDNTTQDSRQDIQDAIDNATIAGHFTVFIPAKAYYVGSPGLNLDPNTIFIGSNDLRSLIVPHGSWQPTSQVYVVTSADDANGTAHMSHVGIRNRTKDGTGGGTSTPFQFDHFSWTLWRTGKNSSSIQPQKGREFQVPQNACQPKFYYSFSGNAGGKHYGFSHSQGRFFGHADCRSVKINGTTAPLHIYGCNLEIGSSGAPDADINLEINNSSNIRIYGNKREGHGSTALVNDCDNIALYGFGRQVETRFAYNVKFTGSTTNCLIGVLVADQDDWTSTSQGNPEQNVDVPSGSSEIQFPEGCSLYKLGTLNDAAATI